MKLIRNNYKWLICFLCLTLVIYVTIMVLNNNLIGIDSSFYNLIKEYLFSDNMTKIIKIITFFGSSLCIIIISILLVILVRDKNIKVLICSNLILVTLFNQLLKHIIKRPRPYYKIIEENGYSFPSGHSMVSMAFYGLLIYLIYKYIRNKYLRYSLIIILSILIILIGISRIYLGVHYTTDVVCGYLLAIICLIVNVSIYNKNRILIRK